MQISRATSIAYSETLNGKHWLQQLNVFISFLKELGFAAFIAWIITITVEIRARLEITDTLAAHTKSVEERLDAFIETHAIEIGDKVQRIEAHATNYSAAVSREVFEAVLGRIYPRGYAKGVIASALDTNFVRMFYRTEFLLTKFPDAINAECGGRLIDKIRLTVRSDYVLRNISENEQPLDIRVSIPQISEQGLEKLAVLENVTIDHNHIDGERCEESRTDKFDMFYKSYVFPVRVSPQTGVRVGFVYSLVKDLSDTEIWTSIFPTIEAEVDVRVEVPRLTFGLRALNREQASKIGSAEPKGEGTFRWKLPSPLLPYQGFVFWWRPQTGEGHSND